MNFPQVEYVWSRQCIIYIYAPLNKLGGVDAVTLLLVAYVTVHMNLLTVGLQLCKSRAAVHNKLCSIPKSLAIYVMGSECVSFCVCNNMLMYETLASDKKATKSNQSETRIQSSNPAHGCMLDPIFSGVPASRHKYKKENPNSSLPLCCRRAWYAKLHFTIFGLE